MHTGASDAEGTIRDQMDQKEIFDVPTGQKMPCDMWWIQVWHARYAYPLFCATVRVKRRWHIETSFRYGKCELARQSPRLWAFENRLKLLSIVTLVDAFLLQLLEPW